MPTIARSKTKLKTRGAAPVTALASRDRLDVPTAKRRARRRSEPTEAPTMPIEAPKLSENRVTLPPPGENPGGTPTRSETQLHQGVQGRMTMRMVALDLGAKKTTSTQVDPARRRECATTNPLRIPNCDGIIKTPSRFLERE